MSNIVLLAPGEPGEQSLTGALQAAGLEPQRVSDAESVIRILAQAPPKAVILDSSYLEPRFIESLRLAAPTTPIILLVDADQEQLRLKALMMGVEECVVRPCSDQEVVIRLFRVLDNQVGVDHMNHEIRVHRDHAQEIRGELAGLRQELHRHLSFLKHGVAFHRDLDPSSGRTLLLQHFLRSLGGQLGVTRLAYLGLSHEEASWYRTLATWGVPESLCTRLRIPASGKVVSLAARTAGPVSVASLKEISGAQTELGILDATGFMAVVPQIEASEVVGLVLLGECSGGAAPGEETLALAEFLTSSLTPVLAMQKNKTQDLPTPASVVASLVGQLESRDPYLQGHSIRVARMCEEMGIQGGMGKEDLSRLVIAATIHDVGRFESDAKLWSKEGPLTHEDWDLVQAHPLESARLAAAAGWPEQVLDGVRHHHERWDGTGYPFGLEGKNIPLFSRIIAIADGYDALTHNRSWRPQLSPGSALAELQRGAGSRYDPELMRIFLEDGVSLQSA